MLKISVSVLFTYFLQVLPLVAGCGYGRTCCSVLAALIICFYFFPLLLLPPL